MPAIAGGEWGLRVLAAGAEGVTALGWGASGAERLAPCDLGRHNSPHAQMRARKSVPQSALGVLMRTGEPAMDVPRCVAQEAFRRKPCQPHGWARSGLKA